MSRGVKREASCDERLSRRCGLCLCIEKTADPSGRSLRPIPDERLYSRPTKRLVALAADSPTGHSPTGHSLAEEARLDAWLDILTYRDEGMHTGSACLPFINHALERPHPEVVEGVIIGERVPHRCALFTCTRA